VRKNIDIKESLTNAEKLKIPKWFR